MTARAYSVYVSYMREAIERAGEFTAGLDYARFMTDNLAVYATLRALEILGEAAKRVPEDIRAMDSAIPWRQKSVRRITEPDDQSDGHD